MSQDRIIGVAYGIALKTVWVGENDSYDTCDNVSSETLHICLNYYDSKLVFKQ